jgi:CRP/FNR family cyclic AMP-dependent transcriptional regulator
MICFVRFHGEAFIVVACRKLWHSQYSISSFQILVIFDHRANRSLCHLFDLLFGITRSTAMRFTRQIPYRDATVCRRKRHDAGLGRRVVQLKPKHAFFSQGGPADSIFYLQAGRAKLTVVSKNGKEATITLLSTSDFIGEESLATVGGRHMTTATAITACTALEIEREEMVRVMHEEHSFSDLFLKFLLVRSMRTQADLVDQLFNSSEKRLARILLLLAEFGKPGEPESLIPEITQETLAEMIGTTRSRVSFFMNRFRKLGFIEYNGRIQVHKSLLNIVLHD